MREEKRKKIRDQMKTHMIKRIINVVATVFFFGGGSQKADTNMQKLTMDKARLYPGSFAKDSISIHYPYCLSVMVTGELEPVPADFG